VTTLSGVIQAYAENLASQSIEAAAEALSQERAYRRLNVPTL
jgi:hypothetical protein